jgi:hypothetical protein
VIAETYRRDSKPYLAELRGLPFETAIIAQRLLPHPGGRAL